MGGLEKSRAKTVTPVPPGTALHQLYSVPPTGRDTASEEESADMYVVRWKKTRDHFLEMMAFLTFFLFYNLSRLI